MSGGVRLKTSLRLPGDREIMRKKGNIPIPRPVSRPDLMVISGAYLASQVFFWVAGGKFDVSLIFTWMHFLDPDLMRTRLLESLWYTHIQPPLFNLFTAFGLRLFPISFAVFFAAVFILLGLVMAWVMYWLSRSLGVAKWLAMTATILYVTGPADMYFRNWYLYTYPVMAMLIFSAGLLFAYLSTGRPIWGWSFFGLLGVIMMTRYSFHFIWFAAIAAGLFIMLKTRRRQIAVMVAFPALICLIWLSKNYYLFSSFSMTSWFGYNISNITILFLTPDEADALEAEGKISPLSRVSSVASGRHLHLYEDYLQEVGHRWHPAPVLHQMFNSTGMINYNHVDYIPVTRQIARDSLAVIRYHPKAYLRGLKRSSMFFFWSTLPTISASTERSILLNYHWVWMLLGGSIGVPPSAEYHPYDISRAARQVCWLLVIFYILAPAVFIHDLIRGRGLARLDHARLLTIGFLLFNLLYVSTVGILVDCGENNRFRAEIVPLTVVLAAVILQRIIEEIRVKKIQS